MWYVLKLPNSVPQRADDFYNITNLGNGQGPLQLIKESFGTIYHAACTCAMGKRTNPLDVVDSHAKVFGVNNLRVVDASAFQFLPPGHPMATVYALAEKIADDIASCI